MVKHFQMSSVITPEQNNKKVLEQSYSCDLNSALYNRFPNPVTRLGLGGCLWPLSLFSVPPVGHCLHFPNGALPNPKVVNHENQILGSKKPKKTKTLFYLFSLSCCFYRLSKEKVRIKVQAIQVFCYLTITAARTVANQDFPCLRVNAGTLKNASQGP